VRSDSSFGLKYPEILIPDASLDLAKWSVIACDQFTSEPEYWNGVAKQVGDAPSTLHCILPECFLGAADLEKRIENIHDRMRTYLEAGLLRETPPGVVLVERKTSFGRTRRGMIAALDLECYDFRKGSRSLIRPTEGTIVERLPPRIRVRKNASVEFPHIIILIDDPGMTVIEPLFDKAVSRPPLYESDLAGDGGSIRGWFLPVEEIGTGIERSLTALADRRSFSERYGTEDVLLFAVGDGNHSLATAKSVWDELKRSLDAAERDTHPARWALVEIENLYDPGIVFEPIHRALFGLSFADYRAAAEKRGGITFRDTDAGDGGSRSHVVPVLHEGNTAYMDIRDPAPLAAEAVERLLSDIIGSRPEARIDYIHGKEALESLSAGEKILGFELRPLDKGSLFPTVIRSGVLPKKAFSIGEAAEKRYYLEGRRIQTG